MRKLTHLVIKSVSLFMAVLVALLPASLRAAPQHADPVKIRIEVSEAGFNGHSGEYVVEVEQGQVVELTFVWAHTAPTNEEHIMKLDGYKLETETINSAHKEATLKFPADKAGNFNFYCDIECDAHDYLQRGILRVRPGGTSGGNSAARIATALNVNPSSSLVATGEGVTLLTTLKDKDGKPVAKADIRYFIQSEFAGVQGKMEIGSAKTDANGVAFFDYQPTQAVDAQTISAVFEGQGLYAESQQAIEIHLVGAPLPAYQMSPIGLDDFRDIAPLALAAAVLGLWSVFGFVLFQAFSIARYSKRR